MLAAENPDVSILVVDDDPDFLTVLEDLLRFRLGVTRVGTAPSGSTALTLLQEEDYDAVISDIRMPDMDGLTLTSKILQLRPETPVLLVTAHGDRELGVEALNRGAFAYIQKPVDREYLLAWVKRGIQMHRLSRHVERQRHDLERRAAELQAANRALQQEIAQHREAQRRLKHTEDCFRLLVEGIKDYAIYLLHPDGTVASWNTGAEMLKGYRAEEVIGHCFSRFYPEEDRAAGRPWQVLQAAREAGRVEDEGWRVRKDGSRFWANVVVTALYDDGHQLRGYAKVTRDLTERRRREEDLLSQLQRLQRRGGSGERTAG